MSLRGSIGGELAETAESTSVITDEGGAMLVRSNNSIREVFYSKGEASDGNVLNSLAVEVESERQRIIRERFSGFGAGASSQASTNRAKVVKAPMPGLVKVICVAIGDLVKKSTPIIILEAMKMENSITAGSDGVIAKIHVIQGTSVEKNGILCELEA